MGSSETRVVSRDELSTRLPAVTSAFETRRVERRFDRAELRRRDGLGRGQAVELLARDRVLLEQPRGPLLVGGRELELGSGALPLGGQALDLGLERPGVDPEQRRAGFDAAALVEMHGFDVAADARAHFDRLDGLQPAGEFLPLVDRPHRHRRDRHFRRRRRGLLDIRVAGIAAGQDRGRDHRQRNQAQDQGEAPARDPCIHRLLLV
jgi:hypothetical protein